MWMGVEGKIMVRAQQLAIALLAGLAFSTGYAMAAETSATQPNTTELSKIPPEVCKVSPEVCKALPQLTVKSCEAKCIEPHAACAESSKVIDTLQELANAVNKHDLTAIAEYLDDSVTTFDEGSKKLVVGKDAVLADLKIKLDRFALTGDNPLLSYTIVQPYAQVSGNTAVVTFTALREFGGSNPRKEKCNATDVFVKVDNKWKKLHYRGRWKRLT